MSRIYRPRIEPGSSVDAADLDARFADFDQAGALSAVNLRDGAVDLPQLKTTNFFCKNAARGAIGINDLYHASPNTLASYTGGTFPTPTPVADGGGTATPLALGAGWSMVAGDILRVYWDLSVRPRYLDTAGGGPGRLAPNTVTLGVFGSASTTTIGDNGHAWLAWLEWDITSASLTNFVPVEGQSAFTSALDGSHYGALLSLTRATTAIPCWTDWDDAQEGQITGVQKTNSILWRGVSGTYYYVPTGPVTIYGIRVVIAGIAHAFSIGSANLYAWDANVGGADQYLEYTGGGITAIQHRMK